MHSVKGFYWTPPPDHCDEQLELISESGANTVIVPHASVNRDLLRRIKGVGLTINIDIALFSGAQLREEYTDCAPFDEHGRILPNDDWYVPVCPNNPHVRTKHLSALTALLDDNRTEIDGVWLDFIRFPVRWEKKHPDLRLACFCNHCLNLFLKDEQKAYTDAARVSLATSILRERYDEWVTWKCRQIAEFVSTIRRLLREGDQRMELGLFCLPWRPQDFDGAITAIAGQDVEQLALTADCLSPMVYHKLCDRDVPWLGDVVQDLRSRITKPVLPAVQSLDHPATLSVKEFAQSIELAMDASDYGVIIFDFDSVQASPDKLAVVHERF
jgi:hypothetical protein